MKQNLIVSENSSLEKEIKNQLGEIESRQIIFCRSDEEAFNYLRAGDSNSIITNFDEDHEREIKLLESVKKLFPNAFRSSIAEDFYQQKSLDSLNMTHRIIRKPIMLNEFHKIFTQFDRLNRYSITPEMVTIINGFGSVPVLPEIYTRLENEINSEDVSIHRISDIISHDPLMTAKILHIVNSSFFMTTKGVTNLIQSINFLGINIVKSLFLYVKIFSVNNTSVEIKNAIRKLRLHSLNVAQLTKAIIGLESFNREYIEIAFLSGLLHDIGKLVLMQEFGDKKIISVCENPSQKIALEDERKLYGTSHLDVGAYLLTLWGFDEEIIDSLISHHDMEILDNTEMTLKKAVFIADSLCCGYEENLKALTRVFGTVRLASWTELIPLESDARLVA